MCSPMQSHATHVQRLPLGSLSSVALPLAARREPSPRTELHPLPPQVHLPPKQPAEEAAALRAAKPRLGKIRWARKSFTHTRVRARVRACLFVRAAPRPKWPCTPTNRCIVEVWRGAAEGRPRCSRGAAGVRPKSCTNSILPSPSASTDANMRPAYSLGLPRVYLGQPRPRRQERACAPPGPLAAVAGGRGGEG